MAEDSNLSAVQARSDKDLAHLLHNLDLHYLCVFAFALNCEFPSDTIRYPVHREKGESNA
jgi:hypothetical protein